MAMNARMESGESIGDYLIKRIYEEGARHVFGVPGDYVLGFFKKLARSPLQVITTCDEQGAGFAADAYARTNGFGVVCVTYGVGGLKITNTTGQAYAEKSPVLVISGSPGMGERIMDPLLHHKVHQFDDQVKIFERLTVASGELGDPERAFQEVDRVISAVRRYKRPGYLEIPRDMVSVVPVGCRSYIPVQAEEFKDPSSYKEALSEAIAMINSSDKPVILAGVEVKRFKLWDQVTALARKAGIPIADTILGKSAVSGDDPLYMGVYTGGIGDEEAKRYVESSDCIVMLGVFLTDLNFGTGTIKLDPSRTVYITSERVAISRRYYLGVGLDLLSGLAESDLLKHDLREIPRPGTPEPFCDVSCDKKITAKRLFEAINAFIDEKTVLVPDVGDALFGSVDITIHGSDHFLSSGYYASMGFAVPAAIGVQIANKDLRPIVLTGDGSFQMTGMEISTAARYGLCPIIVVINNGGYETERLIVDGPFNDISAWKYSKIPEVIGAGKGFVVLTEDDLERALTEAMGLTIPCILDVILAPHDVSRALQKIGNRLKDRNN